MRWMSGTHVEGGSYVRDDSNPWQIGPMTVVLRVSFLCQFERRVGKVRLYTRNSKRI